ncbi:uncharacterized protein LOC110991973 [Pieris rapae]|uniref:uncharacterized protein LOC110991973 n=1 Tax=Pieris rapae TaxID=64459 RepID=UPI001E27BFAE|nr:uncharacterized protein LOC110991973 [Pieris rapae]
MDIHESPKLCNSKETKIAFGRMTSRSKMAKDLRNVTHEEKKEEKTKPVKIPIIYLKKNNAQSSGHLDIAGEPATSRKAKSATKKLELPKPDKQPSRIPRRNISFIKKKPSKDTKDHVFLQNQNVQRVQVFNSPGLRDVDAPVSVTATRPIPTLGIIYGNTIFSSDVYNDYFLGSIEQRRDQFRPQESEIANNSSSVRSSSSKSEDVSQIQKEQSKNTVVFRNFFKTTNENVKEWLSSELEKPTRDHESVSGYHSVNSPRNCSDPSPHSSSKESKADIIRKYSMLFKKRREPKKSVSTADISKKSSTANSVKSKTTKLTDNREVKTKNPLPKMNTDIKPLKPSNVGFYATFKFPSTPNPTKRREHGTSAGACVPSYVECASEVLQKTTNFETEGRDTPSTLNGKENLPNSSQVLDNVSEITDQLDWRLPSSQCSTIFKTSKESETTVSTWHDQRDLSSDYSAFKYPDNCSYHEYFYHYCWRKEIIGRDNDRRNLRDSYGRCKKCHKYRNYPTKSNISRRLVKLKNRIALSRVCKHRLNRVWKKTTQRFSDWSKSTKYTKFRMLYYLQRYHFDNADVQTTMLVYHETGTDARALAQKSAAITTENVQVATRNELVGSNTSTVPKNNHVNVGPSIFPMVVEKQKPQMISEAISIQKSKFSTEPKLQGSELMKNSKYIETEGACLKNMSTNLESAMIQKVNQCSDTMCMPTSAVSALVFKNEIPRQIYPPNMMITCHNAATEITFKPTIEAPQINSSNICQCNLPRANNSSHTAGEIKCSPTKVPPAYCDCGLSTNTDLKNNYSNIGKDMIINPLPISPTVTIKAESILPSEGSKRNDSIQLMSNKDSEKSNLIRATATSTHSTLKNKSKNESNATMASPNYKSNIKISTGTLTTESSFQDTPSVITDTLIPCKRLENRGLAKLTTPKGTVLTCAGTKITSVSSVNLQTCSVFCKPASTINTAMTTNLVSTRNTQCFTAPSLFRRRQRDTSIGLDVTLEDMKQDGWTSTNDIIDLKCDIALSTTKLIDTASFNCGAQLSQRSFNDDFRPTTSTVFTNTELEVTEPKVLLNASVLTDRSKYTTETYAQYSNKGKNDSLASENIGRSQLMSVRMLGDSVSDMSTQARPLLIDAETRTMPKGITSAAVFTSRFELDRNPRDSKENVIDLGIAEVKADIKSNKEMPTNSQQETPPPKQQVFPSQAEKSNLVPRHPSVVISSNLNAAKWMNGCTKDDYQSIIDISEMTVSESLEKATLAVATSNAFNSNLSANPEPAVNCMSTRPLGVISTVNLADVLPKFEGNEQNTQPTNDRQGANEDEQRESALQVRPNTCDAGINVKLPLLIERRSATVHTSRHILNRPKKCHAETAGNLIDKLYFLFTRVSCYKIDDFEEIFVNESTAYAVEKNGHMMRAIHGRCGVAIYFSPPRLIKQVTNCLYVYDRARCVVHSQRTDTGVQIKSTHSGFRQENKVKPWQDNRTVGLVTSVLKPHYCHRHTSGSLGEVLTPQVYKTLYETSRLIAKDRSLSKEIGIVENKAERSVQVLRDDWSCVICPYCAKRFTAHEFGNLDVNNEWLEAELATCCRNHSNYLIKNITRIKDNFKKHLPISRPQRDFVEACTMKPSGRQDKNCQAKFAPEYLCQNCILPPTASATDIRGEESHDLRTVYYFLAAIEGRVRRLKQNL